MKGDFVWSKIVSSCELNWCDFIINYVGACRFTRTSSPPWRRTCRPCSVRRPRRRNSSRTWTPSTPPYRGYVDKLLFLMPAKIFTTVLVNVFGYGSRLCQHTGKNSRGGFWGFKDQILCFLLSISWRPDPVPYCQYGSISGRAKQCCSLTSFGHGPTDTGFIRLFYWDPDSNKSPVDLGSVYLVPGEQ